MKLALAALVVLVIGGAASAQVPVPEERRVREIYRELIEIDTTDSVGDTTKAAEAMLGAGN